METTSRTCVPDSVGLKANLDSAKLRREITTGDHNQILQQAKNADTNLDGYIDPTEFPSFKSSLTSRNALRFAEKYYAASEVCPEFMIDAMQFNDNDG